MSQYVKAIYRNGLLQPLDPLDLKEDDVVTLSIERIADNAQQLECDYFR